MPVGNSRQNQHGWWGTLTIDRDTESNTNLEKGTLCVFIKTSRESHYVTVGTFIKKVRVFENSEKAREEFNKKAKQYSSWLDDDIKLIGIEYPGVTFTFVEILELDNVNTTPLADKLNEYTRKLFTQEIDAEWLQENAQKVGRVYIEAGLSMPSLPFK